VSVATGFISLSFSAICMALYVIWGRFNRVAMIRREVIGTSILKHATELTKILDEVSDVISKDERTELSEKVSFISRTCKFMAAFLFVIVVAAMSVTISLGKIIFSSLIILRGFSFGFSIDFTVQVTAIFEAFRVVFGGIFPLLIYCLYPFEVQNNGNLRPLLSSTFR
jgi:hypothetical protein